MAEISFNPIMVRFQLATPKDCNHSMNFELHHSMARSYVVACQCGDFGLAFQSLNGKILRKKEATFKDGTRVVFLFLNGRSEYLSLP